MDARPASVLRCILELPERNRAGPRCDGVADGYSDRKVTPRGKPILRDPPVRTRLEKWGPPQGNTAAPISAASSSPPRFRDRPGIALSAYWRGPWTKFHCSSLYGVIGKAVVFLCCNPFYLRHLNSLLLNSRCVPTAAGVCGLISFNRPTRPVTSSAYSVAPSARNRKLSWSNTNRSPVVIPFVVETRPDQNVRQECGSGGRV